MMLDPTSSPIDLQIMDRLTSTVANLDGIRGVEYSSEQRFDRPESELMFANIWDYQEDVDMEQATDQIFVETLVTVAVQYRFDPRVKDQDLLHTGKRIRGLLFHNLVRRATDNTWWGDGLATDFLYIKGLNAPVLAPGAPDDAACCFTMFQLRYNCHVDDFAAGLT